MINRRLLIKYLGFLPFP